MRPVATILLTLIGVLLASAQIDKAAEEWLQQSFQAYSQLQSLQSRTTVTVLMITPRYPNGMPVQKYLYAYTLQPPAKLNLLVKDANAPGEGQRYVSDGQTLRSAEGAKPVGNSGAALLEMLSDFGVLPTYDIVFALGGKPSQEKFRKQITRLRIAREDEQQVVLTGRIRNERGKEDGLEITIDKNSKLIRTLKIRNEVTIDDQPGALELVMEFEPSPNVPVSEQTWSMPQK